MANLFKEYPDLLSVQEVQRALRIGRSSAYELLQSGKLGSLRIGSVYRIPKTRLIEFVSKQS